MAHAVAGKNEMQHTEALAAPAPESSEAGEKLDPAAEAAKSDNIYLHEGARAAGRAWR